MDMVYFLKKEKEGKVYHLFKGIYVCNAVDLHEYYSLCEKVIREQSEAPIIKNQTQDAMLMICEKSKIDICKKCQSILNLQTTNYEKRLL